MASTETEAAIDSLDRIAAVFDRMSSLRRRDENDLRQLRQGMTGEHYTDPIKAPAPSDICAGLADDARRAADVLRRLGAAATVSAQA